MNSRREKSNILVFFWVILCALAWAAVFCLWGCVSDSNAGEEAPARVSFLDVGQGLAVLLEQNGRYALFDAGPDSAGIWDTLQARGVDTLEWVVVSHNHRDHGGGLLELISAGSGTAEKETRVGSAPPQESSAPLEGTVPQVHVRRLFVGPDTSGGFVRDSLLRVANLLRIPVDTLYRGEKIFLQEGSGGLFLKVLWPPEYLPVDGNGASLVMQVSMDGVMPLSGGSSPQTKSTTPSSEYAPLLLTGDLDSAGEHRLLELSQNLGAELLQVGHHGSAGSSSLQFLNRVSPRYAVISVGANNGYGHPAPSVLRKLDYILNTAQFQPATAVVHRTDLSGSATYTLISGVGILPE